MNNKEQKILDNVIEVRDAQQGHTDLTVQNEDNSETRHTENCNLHGTTRRFMWAGILGLIGIIALGFAYHFSAIGNERNQRFSLQVELEAIRAILDKEREQKHVAEKKLKAVVIQNTAAINQVSDIKLAAEQQRIAHHKYHAEARERQQGYINHIIVLNQQLDAKDMAIDRHIKTGKRYREQLDTKNQFMALARTISYDNPVRMEEILKDGDGFPRMIYYRLAIKMAIGLQAFNVLEWIQTLDGWDSTITDELVAEVRNPQTVTLAKYKELKSVINSYENQREKMEALEDGLSFAGIIKNLPTDQKDSWDHFAKQVEKHGKKKVFNYSKQDAKKNPKEVEETATACGFDY